MTNAEKPNESNPPKTIGVVFVDRFADWEFGLLSASAVEWFGARTVAITPNGEPVRSMSGFQLNPLRSANTNENADLDAVAVIGSDLWSSCDAPDVSALLTDVAKRGGVVGGICGATLALAKAGLFDRAGHTSNSRDFVAQAVPDYAGAGNYRDGPGAVADNGVVSAPGSAPGTFAIEFLAALYPEQDSKTDAMRALFAREYAEAS